MAWPLFGLVAAVYLLASPGHLQTGDLRAELGVAQSLVAGNGFQVAPSFPDVDVPTTRGKDGKPYSRYGLGESLLLVPAALARGRQPLVERLAAYEQALIAALAVLFLYFLALAAGAGDAAAIGVALLFAFGSPQLAYAHDQFDVTAAGAALLAAAWLWLRERAFLAGLAAGVALLIRLTDAVALLPLAVWIALAAPRRLLAFLLPVAAALGAIGWYDLVRFGSAFQPGYLGSADLGSFGSPLVGMAGLLVSPGKGLLWYCPPILVAAAGLPALWQRRRGLTVFILVALVANLAFFGAYQFWPGDWSWGPRYLVPILGLLLLPAAEVQRPAALIAAGVAGFAVNLLDVLVDFRNVIASALLSGHDIYAPRAYWTPTESEIWRHAVAVAQLLGGRGVYPGIYHHVDLELGVPPTAWWDTWWLIDLWWGRWPALLGVLLLAGLAVECGRRIGRLATSEKI